MSAYDDWSRAELEERIAYLEASRDTWKNLVLQWEKLHTDPFWQKERAALKRFARQLTSALRVPPKQIIVETRRLRRELDEIGKVGLR